MYKSIMDAIVRHGEETPDRLAVADSERSYSYREFIEYVRKCAVCLLRLKDERNVLDEQSFALIECTQDALFLALKMACEITGVVFVPYEKDALVSRVEMLQRDTGAFVIIGQDLYRELPGFFHVSDFRSQVDEVLEVTNPVGDFAFCQWMKSVKSDSVAEILFSTGTTGKPKGIMLSNAANVAVAENIIDGVCMEKEAVELIPLPLSHSHGLRTCYANLLNGSAVVICDGITNIGLYFSMIDTYHVNALDISPTLARLLLRVAKAGLKKISDSILYIEIGTAVLDDDTKERLKQIFGQTRLYNFYGSTEAGRCCALNFREKDFSGCIGKPTRHSTFMVVDDDRQVIASSFENPGLICVSGAMMMSGYFRDEALSRETVIDGVLYTSDLGYIDENGLVFLIGRKDDVINYKGIKIAPEEIESVVLKNDQIASCACVPKQDAICGQVPKLFVELHPSAQSDFDPEAFIQYLKEHLDAGRVPVEVQVIEEIPKSSNGKILRKQLRESTK